MGEVDHFEQLLIGVINSIEDGAAIYDADDRLMLCNDSYSQYFHLVSDIIKPGVIFSDIFRGLADRGGYDSSIGRNLEGWIAHRVQLFRDGTKGNEFQLANGRWTRVDYYKLDSGGRFVVTADITDSKQSELSLRRSEGQYRTLFEQCPLGLAVEDLSAMKQLVDQSILAGVDDLFEYLCAHPNLVHEAVRATSTLEVNTALLEMFGAGSREDYVAEVDSVDQWWNDDWVPYFAKKIAHLTDTRIVGSNQSNETGMNGEAIVVRNINRILQGYEDNWSRVLLIQEDITDRIKAEGKLHEAQRSAEQANRAKGNFLANVSHELRTPLNAIIGLTSVMIEETYGPIENERYREYLDDVHASGEHLLFLVNDIIDISVVEADRLELYEEPLEIDNILDAVVNMVSPRALSADVTVTVTCTPGMPRLNGDVLRTKQVFLNLLTNAVKFTAAGGEVTVSAGITTDGEVEVIVADTGVGMTPSEIAQADVPFSRGESAHTRKIEGVGLGLPLTFGLVKAHGGIMTIESTIGKGTTIAVRFPSERVLN